MRFVLLTVALFTACMTSVAAHPNAASLPSSSGSATAARVVKATPLAAAPDGGKRVHLQAGTEVVKVNLPPMPLPARQASHAPDRASAAAKESETERSYGMPLAALALMVAIAVRRSKAGRP